jgi:flagellar protein FlbD
MIHLTRLNHSPLVLNCDLIEHVEVTPDTVISLTTGEKIMVRESAEEVVARVIDYRRSIFNSGPSCPLLASPGEHPARAAEFHKGSDGR